MDVTIDDDSELTRQAKRDVVQLLTAQWGTSMTRTIFGRRQEATARAASGCTRPQGGCLDTRSENIDHSNAPKCAAPRSRRSLIR
jgi:hypothetical protein